jgi:hypothetical protein
MQTNQRKVLLLSILITILSVPTLANQAPCLSDKNYQAFDFWLGDWQVTDAQGVIQGSNQITKSEDSCLIHEHWTSALGNKGYSLNYYNPVTRLWAQRWVSAGSVIEYTGTSEQPGVMTLKGKIYYQQNGLTADFKGTWTLLEDGRVRQLFQQYDDKTKQWNVWFEGFYSKQLESKE